MPRHRTRTARGTIAVATLAAALAACASRVANPSPEPQPTGPSIATAIAATTQPTAVPSPSPFAFDRNPAPIVQGTPYTQTIDPASFVDRIDNPFFPLPSGASWSYSGDEDVEVKVLDDVKVILGVHVTVVSDRVLLHGELAEDTRDWFAQDRQGNVWYFGEQTAEYENGKVTTTEGSWEAGVKGAVPGIVMLADPRAGDSYRQEYLRGDAEDLAEVTALSGSVTVGAGSWSGADVLVTEEWTPLEPDVREQKLYVRGVGLVQSKAIKGPKELVTLQAFVLP
ncbi:MAG TPA: hypothetical protein VHR16_02050 [Candidatus Limnocylindrales bacterium]|jgi:hypothetical protein|nr:hypothetical protein [Candidatus Limnocylindrales bacterium]